LKYSLSVRGHSPFPRRETRSWPPWHRRT
jgi:hypothetical protein